MDLPNKCFKSTFFLGKALQLPQKNVGPIGAMILPVIIYSRYHKNVGLVGAMNLPVIIYSRYHKNVGPIGAMNFPVII